MLIMTNGPEGNDISKLNVGDAYVVGDFSVKRVTSNQYILRDKKNKERARWGTKLEIATDLSYCLEYGTLPQKEGGSW